MTWHPLALLPFDHRHYAFSIAMVFKSPIINRIVVRHLLTSYAACTAKRVALAMGLIYELDGKLVFKRR